MPNFSSLARLEVPEKFLWVGGGCGGVCKVIFMSSLVVLCCRWGCDNKKNIILLTFFSMKIPITKHHGHVKYGAHD